MTVASLLAVPNLTSKKSEPEFPPLSPESAMRKHPLMTLLANEPTVVGFVHVGASYRK